MTYHFCEDDGSQECCLLTAQTEFFVNEVSTCFTGTVLVLYTQGVGQTRFDDMKIMYTFA